MQAPLLSTVVALSAVGCGRVAFDGVGVDAATRDGRADSAGPIPYRDLVMADAPIGYWRLGDVGSVAVDETGSVNGTYIGTCGTGAPGIIAADANASVRFNGGTSCYVSLGDTFAFTGNAAYTMELWETQVQSDSYQFFLSKEVRVGADPTEGYLLLAAPLGAIYTERVKAGVNVRTLEVPTALGTSHHMVAVYDGAQLLLYVDGVLAVPMEADASPMQAYTADLRIGAGRGDGFDTGFVDGFIDEVAIYDVALSAAQIARHHDVGRNGP